MNPFRILRDHLISSGVLFTDKQMADAIAAAFNWTKDLSADVQKVEEKLEHCHDQDHKLHKLVRESRRHHREFVQEFRDFEEEYHNLVRYCLRLEERLNNAEKLLVKLTDEPTKEIND